jgi:hypothetical protein
MTADTEEKMALADRLAAAEAISALKARYFRLMDTKCWEEWQGVFAPDAVMDVNGEISSMRSLGFDIPPDASFTWRGAEGIRAAVSGALANVTTVHHGHMPEIEVLSPVEARGIWAMEDMIIYGPEAPLAGFRGYGHYHETYVKLDGRWHIQTVRLTRLSVRPIPRA